MPGMPAILKTMKNLTVVWNEIKQIKSIKNCFEKRLFGLQNMQILLMWPILSQLKT